MHRSAPWPGEQFLVAGMVAVIGHDGLMTVSEIELLGTGCASPHCPPRADARPGQGVRS